MKKIALYTTMILICISLTPVQALAGSQGIIHQQVDQANIARNVTYKCITRFTDTGWHKIHVLEGDMTDKNMQLEALTPPEGLGAGSTLSQMVNNQDTIAAINGDFFISGESYSPLGPVVTGGEMQSSPTYRMDELAVFSLDQRDIPIIDYWEWKIKLTAEGAEFPVSAINKISYDYTYPVVYTNAWGTEAPKTSFQDIVYIVADQNEVVQIIQAPDQPVPVPQAGMVVMARGDTASHMLQTMEVGCDVDLDIYSTPDYSGMRLAIGGGTILVKDGAVYPFTHSVNGNHPRTAIGFSRDGKKLIMVAVEGRVPASRGMDQQELAQLMLDLGAHNAINLDGGGSTTVLARKPGDHGLSLANTPSDGSLRRVSNGISIINTAPKGNLRHILLEVEDEKVFVETGRTITVKGYDSNYNPVDVDQNKVEWSVTGVDGGFSKNVFYPAAAGSARITAEYMGCSTSMDIQVLEAPVELELPEAIKTGLQSSHPFVVYGKNLNGYSTLIENRDLSLSATIGRIENQAFVSGSGEGVGEIRVNFNGLQYNIPVSVGYRRTVLDNFEQPRGSFTSYPDTVTGSYNLDTGHSNSGKASGRLAYDFTATDVTAASYLVFDGDGIRLDGLPERIGVHAYSPMESSHWIRLMVEDSSGKSVNLDLARHIDWTGFKFIDAKVPAGLRAPIYIKRIYVVETNPIMHDAGEVYFDDLTALYPHELSAGTGSSQPAIYDPQRLDVPPEDYSFSFTLFGSTVKQKLIDIHVVNRMKKIANQAEQPAVFAGTIGDNTVEDLDLPVITTKGGYSVTKYDNNTILQLDNHSGGLRTHSPQQWYWLKQQLEGIKGDNLFVVLPRPVWGAGGFTDALEAELLNSYLSDLGQQRSISVYVLTGGRDSLDYDVRDGVKYIGINGTITDSNRSSDLENYSYIRFYVSQHGEVGYQVLPLFPLQ